jgi:REP element-mobilizing transposase RayT
MRHRLFVHIVWTTADRVPLIDALGARSINKRFASIAEQEHARILATGIVSTHVHLLVRLHPTTSITKLVQRLKGTTSRELGVLRPTGALLRWAKGYTIQSVSERALGAVMEYVHEQPAHHPNEAITE